MGDISSIVITLLLFMILIFSSILREKRAAFTVITLGFIIHLTIAVLNGFNGPTIGADIDALAFYREGVHIAQTGDINFKLGSDSYRNLLGAAFILLQPSMFLACMISVAAYLASLFPIIYIVKMLKFDEFRTHIIAAYTFLPSMFLFGSVALRESLQVCFFIFAVKFFLQFYSTRLIRYFFVALIFAFLMGTLHFGLLLFSGVMTALIILSNYNKTNKKFVYSKSKFFTVSLLIFLGIVITIILPNIDRLGVVSVLLEGGNIAEFTEMYRGNLEERTPRSGYEIDLNYSNPFMLTVSLLKMLVYYIAYPFPWKIAAVIDVYACLEGIWRCLLIYFTFKGWSIATGEVRKVLTLLILLFFSLASIWAVGTSNFGTGMRHNLTHYWILTVTGVPYLMLSIRNAMRFLNKK